MRCGRLAVLLVLSANLAVAGPLFLGPTPYLSAADSPFSGLSFTYFYLENFEAGALSSPGVTVTPGAIVNGPGAFTDSVDADDGAIDGSGIAGRSLYSANSLSVFRFEFNLATLGTLPTHAGVVWTDVGNTTGTPGQGPVLFRAFGPGNVPLGELGPVTLGDGSALGGTAEDRFFGVIDTAGISAIEIAMANSSDWEVDHLQYGAAASVAVPEASTLGMLLLAGLLAAAWRLRLFGAR